MTNEGIIIFKDTFEYYKEGELNAKQFSELMMLIYSTRWEDKVIEDKDIKDTKIRLIWKTLKHSVIKSKNNSNNNKKKKEANKVVTSENTPKVDNQSIQDNYAFIPPYKNLKERENRMLENIKNNNQSIQDNYVFKPPYKNLQDYEKNILDAINKTDIKEESISERINSINK